MKKKESLILNTMEKEGIYSFPHDGDIIISFSNCKTSFLYRVLTILTEKCDVNLDSVVIKECGVIVRL